MGPYLDYLPAGWLVVIYMGSLGIAGLISYFIDRGYFKAGAFKMGWFLPIFLTAGTAAFLPWTLSSAIGAYGEHELFEEAFFRAWFAGLLFIKSLSYLYWKARDHRRETRESDELRQRLIGDENEWKRPRQDMEEPPEE